MNNLIGLAFTSPGMAFLAIDRKTYRVYYHDQATLTDFRLFLDQEDNKLPIVFVKNIRDLAELRPIGQDKVKSYVLFEDPKVLSNIEGALLPDFRKDFITEWSKITITPDQFNAFLGSNSNEDFNITENAIKASSQMVEPITFLELVRVIEDSFRELQQDPKDFSTLACKYVTKLINKKNWVASARKPALAAGVPIKTLAELEKSIETSKTSDEIWRAFYDYSTNGITLLDVLAKYSVAKDDFDFIISKLEAASGQNLEFLAAPGISKRKKAKV